MSRHAAVALCATCAFVLLSTSAGTDAAEGPEGESIREALERKSRSIAPPPPNTSQDLIDAADEFARRVSADDPTAYVQTFRAALNLIDDTQRPAGDPRMHGEDPFLLAFEPSPQSIYADPTYVANARHLIREASQGLRVVGGVETTEFPDCVAVGSGDRWCCTGTLVAPNVVVTAGHCLDPCAARVFIGTNVEGEGEILEVADAVQHPDYGSAAGHYDLTVLILERDVTTVTPRAFAPTAAIDDARTVRIVGFGNTDVWSTGGYGVRRAVDVPVASPACAMPDAPPRYGCDEGLELVAGAPFLDRDSCNGDSGGPVYVFHDNEWLVAGATSRATWEAVRPCGDGGIYVRLDKFADWIRSVPGGHWNEGSK